MDDREDPSSYNRVVYGFGAVSFFTDFSTEMMRPVLPFYIESLGGTAGSLGILIGVSEAVSYILRSIAGSIADKLRNYWFFTIAGYALSNLTKPLIGVVRHLSIIGVLLSVDRLGKALRSPSRDALLSFVASRSRMGRTFGIHRFLDQLGATIAPLAASALYIYARVSYGGIILLSIVPGVIAIVLVLLLYSSYKSKIELPQSTTTTSRGFSVRRVRETVIPGFLITLALYGLGYFHVLLVIFAAEKILQAGILIALYSTAQLSHAIMGLYAGKLYDRIGPRLLLFGSISMILVALTAVRGVFAAVILSIILYGLQEGIFEVTHRATIGVYTPREIRGFVYGLSYTILGIALLVSNSIIGYLLDTNKTLVQVYVTTIQLLCISSLILWLRKLRETP